MILPSSFISTQEAANKLGVTKFRIYQLIHSGKLQANKFGRDYWVDPKSLDEYIRWLNYWKDKKDGGR